MEARTQTKRKQSEQVAVNRNLAIEVSFDEILDDLLYPAKRAAASRPISVNGRLH